MSASSPYLRLPLTRSCRRLRCQWCDERRTWATEWNDFVLYDESRFRLQHHDGRFEYGDTMSGQFYRSGVWKPPKGNSSKMPHSLGPLEFSSHAYLCKGQRAVATKLLDHHALSKKKDVEDSPAWYSKLNAQQRLNSQPSIMYAQVKQFRNTQFLEHFRYQFDL
ncbi:hypothetical protein TNCV_1811991 [Trichonephila clavipes]|uniref:Uncharacterized protein n=1 Tax=Trichonephila clavipes TaxID=2585209 RepID=A0A8X6W7J8_TRICX|nr:hypothetical protein TNCV_1811991 [Trichonephila clavipes]